MRRLWIAAVVLAAAPSWAQAPALDEAVMENIEIVNESLSSSIGSRNADASATDARDLDALLAEVENHFVARGDADDAVGYARRSREAAAGILKAVAASQFEDAANLASEISRTCKACHRKYKPD